MNVARSPAQLLTTLCIAEVLTMLGVFAFPALLPTFVAEWKLSNVEAGWISGIHLGAYAISAPLFVSLTDRIDARLIYVVGAALTGASLFAFAFLAEGFWTAFVFRVVAGIGLGATYMPGLRVLVDRYQGPRPSRALAFYTASFSLGTAASFFATGEIDAIAGWRAAHVIAAIAALIAALIIALALRPVSPQKPEIETSVLDFRPVLRNRQAMGYILAYCAHSWELFAMRGWLVAFLAFSLTLQSSGADWISPTTVATWSGIAAMISSILGEELASRFGRRRVIAAVMLISAGLAMVIGFLPALSYGVVVILLLIYAVTIQADSAAITAGTVAAAEPGRRGSTLAVHASVGFLGGAVGPVTVGIVLDLSGGGAAIFSWGLGFASMGLAAALGPIALYLLRPRGNPEG